MMFYYMLTNIYSDGQGFQANRRQNCLSKQSAMCAVHPVNRNIVSTRNTSSVFDCYEKGKPNNKDIYDNERDDIYIAKYENFWV